LRVGASPGTRTATCPFEALAAEHAGQITVRFHALRVRGHHELLRVFNRAATGVGHRGRDADS